MTKENPTGTGSLSMNRKSGTEVGDYSTTLGYGGTAGEFATAEGGYTIATGSASHAEGQKTEATSSSSHAEGFMSIASGKNSHAEGNTSRAIGSDSHAEGTKTIAGSDSSHAEGDTTFAANSNAHAEGNVTAASGDSSHVEGVGSYFTLTLTGAANTKTYTYATDEEYNLMPGVVIKYNNQVYYVTSLNADNNTLTLNKTASSDSALSAVTAYCYYTGAFGMGAHAEGINTIASGDAAHAEGEDSKALGDNSHAEGGWTKALGEYSHAEGRDTFVSGNYSHVEGEYAYAIGDHQHVQGKYNIEDTTSAHIVGNGTNYNAQSNAHTLDWEGNAWFAGDVYVGSTSGTNKDGGSKKLMSEGGGTMTGALILSGDPTENLQAATKQYVDNNSGSKNVWYGTCETAASTAAKVVTTDDDFKLETGTVLFVTFTNAHSASTMTLSVNGSTAVTVYRNGTTAIASGMVTANETICFIYDGTYFRMENGSTASTSSYGYTKLSSSTSSTSTALAATPSAVKSAYDLASAALPLSGGTMTGELYAGTQTESASLLRNSKLVTTEITPTVNGEIIWLCE